MTRSERLEERKRNEPGCLVPLLALAILCVLALIPFVLKVWIARLIWGP